MVSSMGYKLNLSTSDARKHGQRFVSETLQADAEGLMAMDKPALGQFLVQSSSLPTTFESMPRPHGRSTPQSEPFHA